MGKFHSLLESWEEKGLLKSNFREELMEKETYKKAIEIASEAKNQS